MPGEKEIGLLRPAKAPSINAPVDVQIRQISDSIKNINSAIRGLQEKLNELEAAKAETFKYIKGTLSKKNTVPNKDHEVQIKSSNNTIGAKVIGNVLDLMVKNTLAYGYIYGGLNDVTISVMNDYYQIPFDNNGGYYKCTPDASNDEIVVKITGHYLVILNGTVDSVFGAGAAKYQFDVSYGEAPTAYLNLSGGGGESQPIVSIGITDLQAGDTLYATVLNSTGTENIHIERLCLTTIKLR